MSKEINHEIATVDMFTKSKDGSELISDEDAICPHCLTIQAESAFNIQEYIDDGSDWTCDKCGESFDVEIKTSTYVVSTK